MQTFRRIPPLLRSVTAQWLPCSTSRPSPGNSSALSAACTFAPEPMKMERAGLCLFRSIDCRVEHASLGLPGVELSLSLRGDRAGRSADVSPGSSAPRFRPGVACRAANPNVTGNVGESCGERIVLPTSLVRAWQWRCSRLFRGHLRRGYNRSHVVSPSY